MRRNVLNARCERCGHLFVGMDRAEYNHTVTRHVRAAHDGTDPREYIVPL